MKPLIILSLIFTFTIGFYTGYQYHLSKTIIDVVSNPFGPPTPAQKAVMSGVRWQRVGP